LSHKSFEFAKEITVALIAAGLVKNDSIKEPVQDVTTKIFETIYNKLKEIEDKSFNR